MTDGARQCAILLTPVVPEPGSSGRAWRAWDWLCELRRSHDEVHVIVIAPGQTPSRPASLPPGTRCWHVDRAADVTRRWFLLAGWLIPWLAYWTPRVVMDWQHPTHRLQALQDELHGALQGCAVTRVVVFRAYLADLACALLPTRSTSAMELDLDDLESCTRLSLARAQLSLHRPLKAAVAWCTAIQYRAMERLWCPRFGRVWLAAASDAARMRELNPHAADRPNRVARVTTAPLPPPPDTPPFHLLFVGTLDYVPNEEAVHWLVREVLPRLAHWGLADWHLTVVGRHPPPTLVRMLATQDRVTLIPNAVDLTPYYQHTHLAVVPLRHGGGTKLKTLEAFAYGRPVVATPHGVRGLAVQDGVHCRVADSAASFAQAVAGLAHSPETRTRLAHGASHWLTTSTGAT